MKILLVEDDLQLQASLKNALEMKNYEVESYAYFQEVMRLDYDCFNLAILDIELPDGNGIDLCRFIRKTHDFPILFLTAHNHEDMIVEGLEAGANDYITKPFSLNVLYARIMVALRHLNKDIRIGDLVVEMDNYKVYKNNQCLNLTAIEYELLFMFIRNKGRVLTKNQLFDCIERYSGHYIENNTLTVYMKRLRDKLGKYQDRYYIENVRGVGYRLYGNE